MDNVKTSTAITGLTNRGIDLRGSPDATRFPSDQQRKIRSDRELKLARRAAVLKEAGQLTLEEFELIGDSRGGPAGLRAKMSFAGTPKQRREILKGQYPKEGHTGALEDGRLWFLNPKTGKPTLIEEEAVRPGDIADLAGAVPEIVLGTGGELGGAALAGIPGALAGGTAGSVAGDLLREKIATGMLDAKPRPDDERKKELLTTGALGFVGSGVGGLVQKALKPKFTAEPGAETSEKLFRAAGVNPGLLPSQATASTAIDSLDNIASKSFFGQSKMLGHRQLQQDATPKMVDRIFNFFKNNTGISEAEFDGILRGVLEGGEELYRKSSSKLFQRVDELVDPSRFNEFVVDAVTGERKNLFSGLVDVTPVRRALVAAKNKFLSPEGIRLNRKTVPGNMATAMDIIDDIKGDTLSFEAAQVIRSRLSDLLDPGVMGVSRREKAFVASLMSEMESSMEQGAKKAGEKVFNTFKLANKTYSEGKDLFVNNFLARAARSDTRSLASAAYGVKTFGAAKRIRQIIIKADPKNAKANLNQFEQGIMSQLINSSTDSSGKINGNKMLSLFKNKGSSGKRDILDIYFPGKKGRAVLARAQKVATAIEKSQKQNVAGTGGMMIQMFQGGAVADILSGGAFTGGNSTAALSILLGPEMIAKVMVSPRASKWFIHGLTLPKGTKEALNLGTKLLAFGGKSQLSQSGQPPER